MVTDDALVNVISDRVTPWIDRACVILQSSFGPAGGETRQLFVAGLPSVPRSLKARTENVCVPARIPVYVFGLAQRDQDEPSRRHSKVLDGWLDTNLNVADAEGVGEEGDDVIVVFGGGHDCLSPLT